jgi:hypothetical protein
MHHTQISIVHYFSNCLRHSAYNEKPDTATDRQRGTEEGHRQTASCFAAGREGGRERANGQREELMDKQMGGWRNG